MFRLPRAVIITTIAALASLSNVQGQANPGPSPAPKQSLAQLRQRAEAGDAEAQFWLGERYSEGDDVPQDYAQALSWIEKAAHQGHAAAQATLGEFFLTGHGVDRDPKMAASWFRKAAEQEEPFGQDELAMLYEKGLGLPQSDTEAVRWYTRASDHGLPIAQFDLAYMYENGKGVTADAQRAVQLYDKAAIAIPTARHNLAILFSTGSGSVHRDPVTAYQWALLSVSAEFQRILHEKEVEQEPRLGHEILFVQDLAKAMSKKQKKAGRHQAEEWIRSHADQLGEEPGMFANAMNGLE